MGEKTSRGDFAHAAPGGDRRDEKAGTARRAEEETRAAERTSRGRAPVPGDDYNYGYPPEYGSNLDDDDL